MAMQEIPVISFRLCFCFLLILVINANAQQHHEVIQFQYDQLFVNPAIAGGNDETCIYAIGQSQLVDFNNSTQTFILTSHTSLNLPLVGKSGVGFAVSGSSIGQENTNRIKAMFANHRKLGNGHIGFGLGIGFFKKKDSRLICR